MRTRLGLILALFGLVLSSLLLVGGGGASATPVPGTPRFINVDQQPDQLIFDSDAEALTMVQEIADPNQWKVDDAVAYFCVRSVGNTCSRPTDFTPNTSWLRWDGRDRQQGGSRFLTFTGSIPNYVREFSYFFSVTYDVDPDPSVDNQKSFTSYEKYVDPYTGATYYYFRGVSGYGQTHTTIQGPASIPTGSALTLSGTLTCYGQAGDKAPDYGSVNVQYRLPGAPADAWNWVNGALSYNQATGAWSFTVPAWGTTADWHAVGYGSTGSDRCSSGPSAESQVITVVAGTQPPPPPPTLPGAPPMSLTGVTQTTATLDWSPVAGEGIKGYRLGWTSDSGKPQPTWSQVYESPDNPFVMTNLNPGSDYSMYIEAVTDHGVGSRTTIRVHTAAPTSAPPAPNLPPPPPPAGATKPGKPRDIRSTFRGYHHGLVTTIWRWSDPVTDGGSKITSWQIYETDVELRPKVHRAKTGLRPGHRYTFKVRACNAVGCSKWGVGRVRVPGVHEVS